MDRISPPPPVPFFGSVDSPVSWGVFQEVLQKIELQLERRGCWYVSGSRRQGDSIFLSEQFVDRNEMIEGDPVSRRVLHPAGDEDRPRRHQRMEIDKIL